MDSTYSLLQLADPKTRGYALTIDGLDYHDSRGATKFAKLIAKTDPLLEKLNFQRIIIRSNASHKPQEEVEKRVLALRTQETDATREDFARFALETAATIEGEGDPEEMHRCTYKLIRSDLFERAWELRTAGAKQVPSPNWTEVISPARQFWSGLTPRDRAVGAVHCAGGKAGSPVHRACNRGWFRCWLAVFLGSKCVRGASTTPRLLPGLAQADLPSSDECRRCNSRI